MRKDCENALLLSDAARYSWNSPNSISNFFQVAICAMGPLGGSDLSCFSGDLFFWMRGVLLVSSSS